MSTRFTLKRTAEESGNDEAEDRAGEAEGRGHVPLADEADLPVGSDAHVDRDEDREQRDRQREVQDEIVEPGERIEDLSHGFLPFF
jgi:hypothetical protein